ncbi:hypothetical protein Tco_0561050 [Tanacetum coccineum]
MQFVRGSCMNVCEPVQEFSLTRVPFTEVKDALYVISREGIPERISHRGIHRGIPEVSSGDSLSLNDAYLFSSGRDSKMFVGFNENKCYIEDLKREKVLGTGSESGGLYMFDVCKSNCIAKQTKEPFPLSDHKSKNLGELVHLDLWVPYRVHSREGYRYFLTIVDDFLQAQLRTHNDGLTATQVDDQNWSEGNVLNSQPNITLSTPTQSSDEVQTRVLRRSERQSKLLIRLNDYVLSSNVKPMYLPGIEVVENDLGLCMSQRKYYLELLYEYGLLAARPVDIPLPENTVLM